MRNHAISTLLIALAIAAALPLYALADDGFTRSAFSTAAEHGQLPEGIEEGGFYFAKKVDYSFEEAADRLKASLKEQGFSVQFELRPDETFREKLGVEMPPYLILGACNAKIANEALNTEPWMGVLMPCSAVVRVDETGAVWIGLMNPMMLGAATGEEGMEPLALELLHRVVKALEDV